MLVHISRRIHALGNTGAAFRARFLPSAPLNPNILTPWHRHRAVFASCRIIYPRKLSPTRPHRNHREYLLIQQVVETCRSFTGQTSFTTSSDALVDNNSFATSKSSNLGKARDKNNSMMASINESKVTVAPGTTVSDDNTTCWVPSSNLLLNSHMTRFARYVSETRGIKNLIMPIDKANALRGRSSNGISAGSALGINGVSNDSRYTKDSIPTSLASSADGSATASVNATADQSNSNHSTNAQDNLAAADKNNTVANYDALFRYSVEHINLFWLDVIKYCDVVHSAPPVAFLEHNGALICPYNKPNSDSQKIPSSLKMDDFPTWFPGMKLNFAENLLRHAHNPATATMPAVYAATEDTPARVAFTFGELRTRVEEMATALRSAGVVPGDRVAAYMATCPEALVALLATSAVGAVWCSTSPDFGVAGVLERFIQVKPKILLAVNGVMYNEKLHGQLPKLQQIVHGIRQNPEACAVLTDVIVLPFRRDCSMDISSIPCATTWSDFISRGTAETATDKSKNVSAQGNEFEYTQLPFGHPLYIVFSSGTTGKPKGIIHSAGGSLIQHLKELVIHGNLGVGDVYLQYTTTGWMMWQWMVSALACGCAIVTYDGSPLRPTPDILLQVIQDANVSVFGTSAKYIQSLADAVSGSSADDLANLLAPAGKTGSTAKKANAAVNVDNKAELSNTSTTDAVKVRARSPREFELGKLHSIYTTGSPLAPTSYDFVYSHFSRGLYDAPMLSSITGGTDILSLFIGMNTNLPVRRGQLQSVCLGMAVEAWDEASAAVESGKNDMTVAEAAVKYRVADGKPGDLVCTQLFPSMPIGFWNDDPRTHAMYRNAYFSKFPHVWAHGDFLSFCTDSSGVVMLGRSDGTLNPAGVRFGSAELYNIVENFVEFADSLAVGQKLHDTEDERVCLFLVMAPSYVLTEDLIEKLRARIRTQLSSRHVPAVIVAIDDIPYTINGKKVEVAVKRLISGETVTPSGTLRNPESLQLFTRIPELRIPGARRV